MAEHIEVQILKPGDEVLLRGLNAMFSCAFEDPGSYQSKLPSDGYLSSLLAQAHLIAITASASGTVIGGLTAYQLDKFEQERREIYIYDLAVAESQRRRGVATSLIKALQAEAARRHAYVIFVQADPGDAPAIALYEKFGTQETAHHFDIPPGAA